MMLLLLLLLVLVIWYVAGVVTCDVQTLSTGNNARIKVIMFEGRSPPLLCLWLMT